MTAAFCKIDLMKGNAILVKVEKISITLKNLQVGVDIGHRIKPEDPNQFYY